MIRAILFAIALSFLILGSMSVRAAHPNRTPYVCTTLDAAMRTVAYVVAGEMDELRTRTANDNDFKCYFVSMNLLFRAQEIVHAYVEKDVQKVVVRALSPNGNDVWLFGFKAHALKLLHQD